MKMINKNITQPILSLSLAVTLALSPGLYSTTVMADDGAQANVLMLSSSMQFTAPYSVSGLSGMRVRIATPNDETVELSSNGGAISWSTAGYADGEYSYQVNILAGEDNAQAAEGEDPSGVVRVGKTQGRFTLSNGLISQDTQTVNWLDDLNPSKLLGSALEWLVPQTKAANLTASSTSPNLIFDDTDEGSLEWGWFGNQTFAGFYNYDTSTYMIYIDDAADMQLDMNSSSTQLEGSTGQVIFDVGDTAPTRTLVLEHNGDVDMANGDVYVDASTGRLGIDTNIPQEEIHIDSGSSPAVRFDAGIDIFDVGVATSGDFNVELVAGGPIGLPLTIEDSNGYVGVWTPDPTAVLDVRGPSGVAQIRVEDTAGANNSVGTVINAINNGPASIRFHDTFNNETLIFRTTQSGGIAFDNPGTIGEIEFAVEAGGRAKFTGDILVDGVVVHTSSRTLKENFKSVDAENVLDKVNALDISQWNYIDTDDKVKHIGPIAEEFYDAFKLGETRKGISSVDSAGIALLAIQGLSQQLQEKDAQIKVLREENNAQIQALNNRLASVEQVKQDKEAHIVALDERVNELEQMVMTTLVAFKMQQSLNNEKHVSMHVTQ